jgi:hypothetical protein
MPHAPRPAVVRPAALRRAVVALGAALAAGCAPAAPAPAPAPMPAPAAHPGFDAYHYPGDSALRAWRAASPYRWVGFYLPAPCHREASWSGKREAIAALGWGIAVLYVGQQTWEGQAQVTPPAAATGATSPSAPSDTAAAAPVPPPACAPSQLTAERAAADAADAIRAAEAEGFARGTVIYLDVERMERVPPAMHAYHRGWVRALLADGRYRPGIYCHARNAAELHAAAREEFAAAGVAEAPRFWIASAAGFDVLKAPEEVGHPFAAVWQGAFDVRETWGGVTLRVDANVARTPSPSDP